MAQVPFARYNIETLEILSVGHCSHHELAEQELGEFECSRQLHTERSYEPQHLYVDPVTFVIRRKSDDMQVCFYEGAP